MRSPTCEIVDPEAEPRQAFDVAEAALAAVQRRVVSVGAVAVRAVQLDRGLLPVDLDLVVVAVAVAVHLDRGGWPWPLPFSSIAGAWPLPLPLAGMSDHSTGPRTAFEVPIRTRMVGGAITSSIANRSQLRQPHLGGDRDDPMDVVAVRHRLRAAAPWPRSTVGDAEAEQRERDERQHVRDQVVDPEPASSARTGAAPAAPARRCSWRRTCRHAMRAAALDARGRRTPTSR